MANEDKKDFNAMLMDSKDMPKIQIITDEKSIEKYGGDKEKAYLAGLLHDCAKCLSTDELLNLIKENAIYLQINECEYINSKHFTLLRVLSLRNHAIK